MNRLQTHLLIAFLVVLVLTLSVIGSLLLVFLSTRPSDTRDLELELASIAADLPIMTLIEGGALRGETCQDTIKNLNPSLTAFAASTQTRILFVSPNQQIIYDTDNPIPTTTPIRILDDAPLVNSARPLSVQRQRPLHSGVLEISGTQWIFAGHEIALPRCQQQAGQPPAQRPDQQPRPQLYFAVPRPAQTPRLVLRMFGSTFLRPLCQAGILGMLVAFAFSVWLSRSVARPLQAIAKAADKVAQGDYDQQVPVAGPTEAQTVAHAFNEMTTQVKLNQQVQRDFLANVTHELRTPLTSIQGFSQAIMDGVASQPEAAQRAAEIIHEEAGRLNRLVNDLLDLAKIQAGQMQMRRQAVEIDRLLQTVGESLSLKAVQKNIAFHVEISRLIRIAGDGDRLAQVFTNLLDNAIKHTDAGGQVWFRAEMQGDGIMITVQDSGEGIPPEDLSRIFERFYQVDKSRNRDAQQQGAGLGLAITYEIIKAHGGQITVESQVGVGTRFNIWLPALGTNERTVITKRMSQ